MAVLTVVVFLPALQGGFFHWDDDLLFVENPYFRGLGLSQWRWMCTTFLAGHWQPLSWLSYALDFKLWGMNPHGWNATNLLLHALNAVLVYRLCLAFLKKEFRGRCAVAAVAALFWALHPLRVEAVAWLATRGYLLCTTFCLLTVLFYLRAVEQKRYPWSALLCFVLATCTKGIGMMLPPVLLLIDWVPLGRIRSVRMALRCTVEKIPFFILSIVTGATAFFAKQADGGMVSVERYGLGDRVGQAIYGSWFYLLKIVAPRNLSPLYEKRPELWLVLLFTVLLVACVIFLFLFRRHLFPLIGTLGSFFLLIFPMLGITQSGVQLYADRFTYFAAVTVSVLFAAGLARVCILCRTVYGAGFLFVCIFALQTGTYAFVWSDEGRLWNHAVMEDGACAIGHNGLGRILLDQEQYEEALVHLRRAAQLDPRSATIVHNTALALAGLKRYDAALQEWDRAAVMTDSSRETGRIMLAHGWVYEQMGDPVRAEQIYSDLIGLEGVDPGSCATALQLRAVLKIRAGNIGSALQDLQRILDLPIPSEKKEKSEAALKALKKIPEAEAPGIF